MHAHVKVINRAFLGGCSTGTDPCLMALSLETAYSRSHFGLNRQTGGISVPLSLDLEYDLIVHVVDNLPKRPRKSQKMNFNVEFPRNWFEFDII